MDIIVIGGTPGAGKTHALIEEITQTTDRYLVACPRINLIKERHSDIIAACVRYGREPVIIEVHSESGGIGPVVQQVREAMANVNAAQHALLLITHDTLMMLDEVDFLGWNVSIDEQVSGLISDKRVLPVSVGILKDMFDIVAFKTGWSRLVPRRSDILMGDLMQDHVAKSLVALVKWAGSPQGVLVDISRWEEIEGSNRPLGWASTWTYGRLSQAKSVLVAHAGLEHTLTYRATKDLRPDVNFIFHTIEIHKTALPHAFVHYFVARHRGSSTYWVSEEPGVKCISNVLNCLEQRPIDFWATNKSIEQRFLGRLSGLQNSVKVEGSNSLIAMRSCALIYSGKSRYEDLPLLNYFGWEKNVIERARECEDMLQFVLRGRLRDPAYAGDFHIYVYDRWQAEWLAEYLGSRGIATVQMVPEVHAGIMDVERSKAGRKPDATRTAEQKKKDRREKDKERKERKRRASGIGPRERRTAS